MAAQEILGHFELAREIDRLTPGPGASGRRAETLVKADRLRVVLVTMLSGAVLDEHTAPGTITIHSLRGRFMVTVGDAEHALPAGDVIAIDTRVPHAVRALDDGAFLLTIGWGPGVTEEPAAVQP